jgi:HK97 gp10 family phage protein
VARGFDARVKLNWRGQEVFSSTLAQVEAGLHSFGRAVRDGAKARAPVRTGRLRFSIGYRVGTDQMVRSFQGRFAGGGKGPFVVVASGMEAECGYGGYVEMGTKHMHGRPYLRPAFDYETSRIGEHLGVRKR